MKKITSFLMMFMLFVGMGWAQTTNPGLDTKGSKAFTVKSHRGYWKCSANDVEIIKANSQDNTNDFRFVLYEKSGSTYLYSLGGRDLLSLHSDGHVKKVSTILNDYIKDYHSKYYKTGFASLELSKVGFEKSTKKDKESEQVLKDYPWVVTMTNGNSTRQINMGTGSAVTAWDDTSDEGNRSFFSEIALEQNISAEIELAFQKKSELEEKARLVLASKTVVTSKELKPNVVYTFFVKGAQKYIGYNPNYKNGETPVGQNSIICLQDPNPEFTFIPSSTENGKFYMYSLAAKKFVTSVANSDKIGLSAEPVGANVTVSSHIDGETGQTYLGLELDGTCIHVSTGWVDKGGLIKYNAPGQPNSVYTVEEIANPLATSDEIAEAAAKVKQFESAIKVNYTVQETGYKFSQTRNGFTIGADAKRQIGVDFHEVVSCDVQNIEASTKEINATLSQKFPFEFTKVENGNFSETNTNWYTLLINPTDNNNGRRDVVYSKDDYISTLAQTKALNRNNMWAFVQVENELNAFYVYNFACGATKTLCLGKNGDGATMAEELDKFYVEKNQNGFVLRHSDNKYLGSHYAYQSTANSGLGTWISSNATEGGSTFVCTSINSDLSIINGNDNKYEGNLVGAFITDIATEVKAAGVVYSSSKTQSNLSTLLDAIAAHPLSTERLQISANKFYQIISYNDKKCQGQAMYATPWCATDGGNSSYGDRGLLIGDNKPVAQTAMKFIPAEGGKYKIQHANSKYWFARPAAFGDLSAMDLPIGDNGNKLVLTNERGFANVWSLCGDNDNGKFFHCGTGNGQIISRHQVPADNDGDLWVIREITEVPVTVGVAKWATLCLPMPVTVPTADGLHVYYVSAVASTGAMTLTEINAGTTIAKETPVLVYSTTQSESDVFTFQVNVDVEATSYTDNKLSGATARRLGFAGKAQKDNGAQTDIEATEYYALGNKGKVAFFPSTSNTVAANKAYMLKSQIPTAATPTALYFSFGDVTGIENAPVLESKEVKYYDLSGKLVLYPSNGVFITSEGKKVFIK